MLVCLLIPPLIPFLSFDLAQKKGTKKKKKKVPMGNLSLRMTTLFKCPHWLNKLHLLICPFPSLFCSPPFPFPSFKWQSSIPPLYNLTETKLRAIYRSNKFFYTAGGWVGWGGSSNIKFCWGLLTLYIFWSSFPLVSAQGQGTYYSISHPDILMSGC